MMTRRQAALACTAALTGWAAENKTAADDRVHLLRVPGGGLQPQVAVDERGTLHLVYYEGDAHKGNLLYVRSKDHGSTFSTALPVNSQPGTAIAAGTIRGAQLAVGKTGQVHVAWNGSNEADPKGPVNPDSGKPGAPMLYSRLDDAGKAFEAQRNLMHHSFGLDGGGSVAADRSGNVYVAWHGIGESEASGRGKEGEARRQVWLTKSQDGGRSFSTEAPAWSQPTGACGCCGLKVFASRRGNLLGLYRSATESVHRDIYLLTSKDQGKSFQGSLLHKWNINACPMSSMDFAENTDTVVGAWETGGQVYWARLGSDGPGQPVAAPGEGKGRKHPRVAVNQSGEVLLAWTEGTGWQRGGSLAWQVFDGTGRPTSEAKQLPGIPAWSFAAVLPKPDNTFSIIY
ncbi:MAG TPA: hypothetical protein VMZ52_15260 [Bryobacteraceae bacterium]|nr:hypothetical protein [Bryobacteraceae bacterium]